MGFNKNVIVLATLLVGSLAVPAPEPANEIDETSLWFSHVDPAARILGGTQASAGSAPHMVALTQGIWVRSFFCGASLISTRTILTAAHCIEAVFSFGSLTNSLQATVGTNLWASGGVSYTIQRNVSHEHYVRDTIKNDIGILITNNAVAFTNIIQPITVSYDWVGANVPVRATGWGRVITGGAISATLLELSKTTVDGDVCAAEVARVAASVGLLAPPIEPHIEICTFHSAGHGMCNGDSGSALFQLSNGHQVGIVSWGVPCARGAPDMFVRVGAYREWMQRHVVW